MTGRRKKPRNSETLRAEDARSEDDTDWLPEQLGQPLERPERASKRLGGWRGISRAATITELFCAQAMLCEQSAGVGCLNHEKAISWQVLTYTSRNNSETSDPVPVFCGVGIFTSFTTTSDSKLPSDLKNIDQNSGLHVSP